ncbi:MAG: DUF86 domain-containing protein [Thermoplasmata archaeon]|nr:DUF86 domain-containing protein [Thermoplasmata archaeon]
MIKGPSILIEHILESIDLIESYIENITYDDFKSSNQLQDAIIRRIMIIGEAIKNLPEEFKNEHPEISWKEIAGMRDVLIHTYFGIDLNLTWETIDQDIPKLKGDLLKIKEKQD